MSRRPLNNRELRHVLKKTKHIHGYNIAKLPRTTLLQLMKHVDSETGGAWTDLLNPLTLAKRTVAAVKGSRKNAPPQIRDWLAKDGSKVITRLTVCREPIAKAVDLALSAISLGQWIRKKKEFNYGQSMFIA